MEFWQLVFILAFLYGFFIEGPKHIKAVEEGREPGAPKDNPMNSWVRF